MVNNEPTGGVIRPGDLHTASRVIAAYVALTAATIVALGVLAAVAPKQATSEAWGHAVIVLVFSVLLPLRMRSARRGDQGALRAVGIIAVVLLAVNLVEAVLPGTFPVWMRTEMVLIVVLMGLLAGLARRSLRGSRDSVRPGTSSLP